MALVKTDEGIVYHTFQQDEPRSPFCYECGQREDTPQHRCASCGEFFDWNQSFNARDWCTDCTDE